MACYYNFNGEMVCYKQPNSTCINDLKYVHSHPGYIYKQDKARCVKFADCPYPNGCNWTYTNNHMRIVKPLTYESENTRFPNYSRFDGHLRLNVSKCGCRNQL